MDSKLPPEKTEGSHRFHYRDTKNIQFSKKEKVLFEIYAKEKGWNVSQMFRVCVRAVIMLEYKQAASLEEALNRSILLDVDGRITRTRS